MKVFGRLSPTFHYRQHRQSPGDSLESPGRGMPEESLELALNLEGQATTGPLNFQGRHGGDQLRRRRDQRFLTARLDGRVTACGASGTGERPGAAALPSSQARRAAKAPSAKPQVTTAGAGTSST